MNLESALHRIDLIPSLRIYGRVTALKGLTINATSLIKGLSIGNQCEIIKQDGTPLNGEVIGIDHEKAIIMPLQSIDNIGVGLQVNFNSSPKEIFPHSGWCGRVINGFGEPIDGKGPLPFGDDAVPLKRKPPNAAKRSRVGAPIDVGIRAINTFLTTCKGQRMGIFSGSGVGKSMLLSMLARYTKCDVCIIGMIGERGREVREFIEETLGAEGLAKSIVIVSTSDEAPLLRKQAAYLALSTAEYFRDQGKDVLCLLDSVTRFAMAQREIGLSANEPPSAKGYTPSVFSELAQLLERAGPGTCKGSITAFFTVLVDGDDHNEPISDAVRGILDGHIVLDRAIAQRGHFPAINVLNSISRTMPHCQITEHQVLTLRIRQLLAAYEEMADMIRLGAYQKGSNSKIDEAIFYYPKIMEFLAQTPKEQTPYLDGFDQLKVILSQPT